MVGMPEGNSPLSPHAPASAAKCREATMAKVMANWSGGRPKPYGIQCGWVGMRDAWEGMAEDLSDTGRGEFEAMREYRKVEKTSGDRARHRGWGELERCSIQGRAAEPCRDGRRICSKATANTGKGGSEGCAIHVGDGSNRDAILVVGHRPRVGRLAGGAEQTAVPMPHGRRERLIPPDHPPRQRPRMALARGFGP